MTLLLDRPNRHEVESVEVIHGMIFVTLDDGRTRRVLARDVARLAAASDRQLRAFKLVEGGAYVRWQRLGADLSVDGLFREPPTTVAFAASGISTDEVYKVADEMSRMT